ncbi:annexin B11 [Musca autumnalis]|uniref:annexin B11 n=1 Tax=Musca autumnalis TaxID=221902 RepID=UPI003CE9B4F3
MYPFGSGMPQPHPPTSMPGYTSQPGMPAGVPFGAGWVAPTQHPHQQQQQQQVTNSHYPSSSPHHAPYPSTNHPAPYPTTHSHSSSPYPPAANAAPYPTSGPYPHPSPYPSNGNQTSSYPGSSYPHNPHHQTPYPTSTGSPAHYHNPSYGQVPTHPSSYNPNHGYTPVRTSMGLESPAGNIQHCFEELAQRQGHTIQHHYAGPRKEVSVPLVITLGFYGFLFWLFGVFICVCFQYLWVLLFYGNISLKRILDLLKVSLKMIYMMKLHRKFQLKKIVMAQACLHIKRMMMYVHKDCIFLYNLTQSCIITLKHMLREITCLIAICRCVNNKAEYFASRLHKSMAGIGTNDKQLIRVIITRCEIDMADIKAAFERMYGKSLKSWIKGDTSGHYKHALYALVGEQRSNS